MIRIGIDGNVFYGKRSGIGRYAYELCMALDRQMPDAQFFVYTRVPLDIPKPSPRWIARPETSPFWAKMKYAAWMKLRCGHLCKKDQIDVFWGCGVFLPWLHSSRMKLIATVYDLNLIYTPDTMPRGTYWQYRLFFASDLRRATTLLPISQGTADKLFRHYGLMAAAIVRPAAGDNFYPRPREATAGALKALGIELPYILFVGNKEPRKNLAALISSFGLMKAANRMPIDMKLVIAGAGGWRNHAIDELIAANDRQDIVELGYVDENALPHLYSGAALFIFPSLYEGYGIPVAEAIACGTPTIVSDIEETREASWGLAQVCEPTVDGISAALTRFFSNPAELKERESAARRIQWSESASILADALRAH